MKVISRAYYTKHGRKWIEDSYTMKERECVKLNCTVDGVLIEDAYYHDYINRMNEDFIGMMIGKFGWKQMDVMYRRESNYDGTARHIFISNRKYKYVFTVKE